MEDIINRGGGNLIIELNKSDKSEAFSKNDFEITIDGFVRKVSPGDKITLTPGESICLKQGVYHRFYGEPGKGKVLVGEVSATNDDSTDNRFYVPAGRFPDIEEDEKPIHLLASDLKKYI